MGTEQHDRAVPCPWLRRCAFLLAAAAFGLTLLGTGPVAAPAAGAGSVNAAGPGDLLWSMRIGGGDRDALYDVARTPDGGVVAVGESNGGVMGAVGDGLVVKYSASGVHQWATAYDDSDAASDTFTHVATAPGGAIVAAGYHHMGMANNDLLVAKYGASGALLWSRSIHGGGSNSDKVNDVLVDASGDVCLVGTAHVPGSDTLLAARLDGVTGALEWVLVTNGYGASDNASGASGAVAHDGSLYIAGQVRSSQGQWRLLLMKVSQIGTVTWARAWRPAGTVGAFGRVVRLDRQGRPWVLAEVQGPEDSDPLLLRYTSSGARTLERRYGFAGARWDYPEDMAVDSSGRVFVCGSSDNAAGTATAGFVVSCSSSGTLRFAKLYPRTAPRDTSFAAVLADGAGGTYVCGGVLEPGAYRHRLMVHYSATGGRAWSRSITNPSTVGDDQYAAMARCGSGGIAAAGWFLYAADDYDGAVDTYRR